MRIWLIANNPQEVPGHKRSKPTHQGKTISTIAGSFSFIVAGMVAYAITLAWLPTAVAAPDVNADQTNAQTTQLLSYEGGASLVASASFLEMVVVDNAIQPDLGIYTLNDSGFVEDAPEINLPPAQKANNEVLIHVVAPGETLSGIADQYGLKLDTILWANDLTSKSTLRAGKELRILPVDGVEHKVASGDTLSGIATRYKASADEISSFNTIDPSKLSVGKTLIIPGGTGVITAPRIAARAVGVSATGSKNVVAGQMIDGIMMPTTGIVTQGYGQTSFAVRSGYYTNNHHGGVDIGNSLNTPIYSAHDGTVTFVGTQNGYGKVIYIKGKDAKGRTVFTRYGHLNSYSVTKNQVVKAGEQIGKMGATGRATGVHLHFEIRSADGTQFVGHEFYQQHLNY